ncbi:hypothetical protein QJS10_CPA10g00509 [Acorus calamus]|uniref:Secreted protein n=1 Tax=Acorus calamus TaxID=4465 RepID=A0AAV9E1Q6_ACOCL|nr:hypothetical protein QJS10_CPA10g00509 [Acorus calamus]
MVIKRSLGLKLVVAVVMLALVTGPAMAGLGGCIRQCYHAAGHATWASTGAQWTASMTASTPDAGHPALPDASPAVPSPPAPSSILVKIPNPNCLSSSTVHSLC